MVLARKQHCNGTNKGNERLNHLRHATRAKRWKLPSISHSNQKKCKQLLLGNGKCTFGRYHITDQWYWCLLPVEVKILFVWKWRFMSTFFLSLSRSMSTQNLKDLLLFIPTFFCWIYYYVINNFLVAYYDLLGSISYVEKMTNLFTFNW
jgi:hypothetical protein